jgi:glutathione S-transferase
MAAPLVLYGNKDWTSPYVFSAFVVLKEKGLPFRLEVVDMEAGEHQRPPYEVSSITGRVPALQHGDLWLAESSAIGEYLEEAFPPPAFPRLSPADLKERARVRMVQALVRSDFMPVREERSTGTLFAGEPVQPLSPGARAAADRLVRIAGSLVRPGGFVASHFTPADADLALILMRLVANGDAVPPPLAAWAREIFRRPSVKAWLANTAWKDQP